jgi:hypothetical protein
VNKTNFVICIDNSEYPASLEKRKIYETIADPDAEQHGQIRVIDESGEDYLYPEECFVKAKLPEDIRAAVVKATLQSAARDNGHLSRLLHAGKQQPHQARHCP